MEWFNVVVARLRALARRDAVIDDIDDELRSHIELETDALVERGMTPETAHHTARAHFGHIARVRELAYEVRGGGMLETLWQDIRYGGRTLRKHPGFAAVAVLTLALGIGANTAIFTVVDAVLFRRLPFPDAHRLVLIGETNARGQGDGVSPANFLDWKRASQLLEDMSAKLDWTAYELTGDPEPEQVVGAPVSADMFRLLRVQPLVGRVFSPDEDRPGGPPVVLLSHHLWQRRFDSDRGIIGRAISVNGTMRSIVGVMPAGFYLNRDQVTLADSDQLWVPLAQELGTRRMAWRDIRNLRVWARLKPGSSREQAQAEMAVIQDRMWMQQQLQPSNARRGVRIVPLAEWRSENVRRQYGLLTMLVGAVTFVLLIACANVANLQLARAVARSQEIAIRLALGAGRLRIVRQLLTESLLLTSMAAGVGVLLAFWGTASLRALVPDTIAIPRLDQLAIDRRVLIATLLTAVLAGLTFGLAPAVESLVVTGRDSLKERPRGSTFGVHGRRFGGLLVVSQIAMASVLLAGAGLLLRSFLQLQRVDPGISVANVLTLRIPAPDRPANVDPADLQKRDLFVNQLLEKLPLLPGVTSAAYIDALPLTGRSRSHDFEISGPSSRALGRAITHVVSAGYFQTMVIPLKRGRFLNESDARGNLPVAVINETMAAQFWPGKDPIGEPLRETGPDARDLSLTVVGIVGDVRDSQLGSPPTPEVYAASRQLGTESLRATIVLRTEGEPSRLVAPLRKEISALDSNQSIASVQTMEDVLARSLAPQRFKMLLIVLLAAIALALATAGIFGVVAYSVAQRTHEMGIRIAMGARRCDVLRLILRDGLALTMAGLVLGLAGALSLTRVLRNHLYEVGPADPATFGAVAFLLVAVALFACAVPAYRATKVDPIAVLRHQ
jgi:putative ABC transport system permease protein